MSMLEKWRLFRREQEDPEPFYKLLASELAADLERRHGPLQGQTLLDLGCGPGTYTRALRAHGADVIPVDNSEEELNLPGGPPEGAVLADASALPFEDASVDAVFCSNLFEHTPDAKAVIREIERVLRPGGWIYISWTNWYSPWGGHDMTPYQYLGPKLGPSLYERRNGLPRKNPYGNGLWACHIGPTLRYLNGRQSLDVERVEPRYWPWARVICRLPAVREVLTWNCVIHGRRLHVEEPALEGVQGWLSDPQAARLKEAARRVTAPGSIVEIGSYHGRSTIALAQEVDEGVQVVAVDPHAGNDRGPQQIHGLSEEGQRDNETFLHNLGRAGVQERVRHVRLPSQEALNSVDPKLPMVYVDGAHRYAPARDDIARWGARIPLGGTLLIHDSFSSVGVTLAQIRLLAVGRRFAYVGRSGSMAEYRRSDLSPSERGRNLAAHLAELPWFARNLAVKVLIVARLRPLARLLGAREWPY